MVICIGEPLLSLAAAHILAMQIQFTYIQSDANIIFNLMANKNNMQPNMQMQITPPLRPFFPFRRPTMH